MSKISLRPEPEAPLALALCKPERGLEELEPEAPVEQAWDMFVARTPVAPAPDTVVDNAAEVPSTFVDMSVDRLVDTAARSCIAAPDSTVVRSCIVAPSSSDSAGSCTAAELTAWTDTQLASAVRS